MYVNILSIENLITISVNSITFYSILGYINMCFVINNKLLFRFQIRKWLLIYLVENNISVCSKCKFHYSKKRLYYHIDIFVENDIIYKCICVTYWSYYAYFGIGTNICVIWRKVHKPLNKRNRSRNERCINLGWKYFQQLLVSN